MLICSRINIRNVAMLCMLLVISAANCAFADFDTDPFYDQRVKLDAPPSDSINEHIDPFSGNMLIAQTDLHLPGNGGLDLTIMRTYNSLIYGRTDNTSFPTLVAAYEKSPLGIGWSMHMGILRSPPCMGCVNYPASMTWGNNPIFELPDGTKQIFYPVPGDNTRMISKDFWSLKTLSIVDYYNHGSWQITSPDGTVYVVSDSVVGTGYVLDNVNKTHIAQVISITNPANTASIKIDYKSALIDKITDSVGRVITFTHDATTKKLKSISTDTRTISYDYWTIGTISPIYLLKTVNLPVKSALNNGTYDWQYKYDSTNELSEITFPAGEKTSIHTEINYSVLADAPMATRLLHRSRHRL